MRRRGRSGTGPTREQANAPTHVRGGKETATANRAAARARLDAAEAAGLKSGEEIVPEASFTPGKGKLPS